MFSCRAAVDRIRIKCIVFLALVFAVVLQEVNGSPPPVNPKCLCKTKGCIRKAGQLQTYMNREVDPCENFYEFACGNFDQYLTIPYGAITYEQFNILQDKLNRDLLRIMKEITGEEFYNRQDRRPPEQPKFYQKIKDCFKSCTDEKRLEEVGLKRFKELIKVIGGWPALDPVDAPYTNQLSKNAVVEKVHAARLYRDNIVIFGVFKDSSDPTTNRLLVVSPYSALRGARGNSDPSGTFLSAVIKACMAGDKGLLNFAVEMAVMLGANRDRALREMTPALDLECALLNVTLPDDLKPLEQRHNNTMTLKEVGLPFFQSGLKLPDKTTVLPDEIVINFSPSYTKCLHDALCKYSDRDFQNMMVFRALRGKILFGNAKLRESFSTSLDVTWAKRTLNCLDFCNQRFALGFAHLYLKKFPLKESKKKIRDMGERMKLSLQGLLQASTWMDPVTKARAVKKSKYTVPTYIYPEEVLNEKLVDDFYNRPFWDWKPKEMLASELRYDAIEFDSLWTKNDRDDWKTKVQPIAANAYFDPMTNSYFIVPPTCVYPSFTDDLPNHITYGALGSFMGHEMAHAFDTKGKHYDEVGRLVDWWRPETQEKYEEKTQCFVDQYNEYDIKGFKVDGKATLAENIADNTGIRAAHAAFTSLMADNHTECSLPGFCEFTPNQMFWISFASTACMTMTKAGAAGLVTNKVHSPWPVRAIGSLSNNEQFAKDFNCKPGSPMNPPTKCRLW